MVLAKPLRIPTLQRILEFISEDVMVVSRPDFKLVEQSNKIQWIPIKDGAMQATNNENMSICRYQLLIE